MDYFYSIMMTIIVIILLINQNQTNLSILDNNALNSCIPKHWKKHKLKETKHCYYGIYKPCNNFKQYRKVHCNK